MTMVNKKGITQAGGNRETTQTKKSKQRATVSSDEDDDEDSMMGTVKVQDKGKKKVHTFKLDKDKISQPVCIRHYKPLDLVAFALVNR